jgi:anti-anti-sigma factor
LPAAPFHVDLSWPTQKVGVVDVAGEIDMHTARELSEVLATALRSDPDRLILDMSTVGFIDSMGLSVLAQTARQLLDTGGALEIVCADAKVLQVFEITGLRDVLTFYPTRAVALEG